MSLYLAVELDDKTKQLLAAKQLILKRGCVAGEWEDPTAFHITVRFLSEDERQHVKAVEALKLWEKEYPMKKFEVVAKDFCRFPQGVEWVGVHNSMPLYEAKYQIEDCFKRVGNQLGDDGHEGYTPHITMGYDVQEKPDLVKEFEPIPVVVDNITLWGFNPKVNGAYIHNYLYRVNFK